MSTQTNPTPLVEPTQELDGSALDRPDDAFPGDPQTLVARLIRRAGYGNERDFLLRVVQPGLVGLIDGTISSLAPIFAAAITADSHTAFIVGLGVALGAGVSMGWSEAGSDTGEETGRGSAVVRGSITGGMTVLGSIFHTLPFLISDLKQALIVAGFVVAVELFAIAWIRNRFLNIPMRSSLIFIAVGGVISLAIGVGLGAS
jgi:erythrin-vacuolar iron transport family protein